MKLVPKAGTVSLIYLMRYQLGSSSRIKRGQKFEEGRNYIII